MPSPSRPSGPPKEDVWLWRGDNDPPLRFEFGTDADPENLLAGSDFLLLIVWPGGRIERRSERGELVVEGRFVTWPYSLADSVAVPYGTDAQYELKRTIAGNTRTWAWGAFRTKSGLGAYA